MATKRKPGSLTAVELAAIDLTISALQASGQSIDKVATDDNPRQQMAEAMADHFAAMHSGIVKLNEHDREILAQIKQLAGQLRSRTSLRQLVNLRGSVLQGKSQSR